jgi:ankyrin repeat protein
LCGVAERVNEKIFSVSVELFGSADALGSRASRPSLSQRAAARVRPKTGMDARRAEAELERRRADALLTACDLGLVDDVARLVAGGATFEATDKSGVRPMVFASARGHSGVVALLLSHGVDANDDDDLGRTALHFAAMHDRADVVRVLVGRKGTWVDALDSNDDTPLHLAARMAGRETVRVLLRHGANASSKNKLGITPLCESSVIRGSFDVAEVILSERCETSRGATSPGNVNGRGRGRVHFLLKQRVGPGLWSFVSVARALGAEDALRWLQEKGVDLDEDAREDGDTESAIADTASAMGLENSGHATGKQTLKPFASLSQTARLRKVRDWAQLPHQKRLAKASGVPLAAVGFLEKRDLLLKEVEKFDFLQKLVDDDEFQRDMRNEDVRNAVDAVVTDFNNVQRFRNDAQKMRTLQKFRVVQRFCKERGFRINYGDVMVGDSEEAEQRRTRVGSLRETAETALLDAARAVLQAETEYEEKEDPFDAFYDKTKDARGDAPGFLTSLKTHVTRLAMQTLLQLLVAGLCGYLAVSVFGFENPRDFSLKKNPMRRRETETKEL